MVKTEGLNGLVDGIVQILFRIVLSFFNAKLVLLISSNAKKELLLKDGSELKPRVKEVFEKEGTYVLFYNKNCNTDQAVPKVEDLRSALYELKKPYAETAKIEIFDANKIAEWVNGELSAVVKVLAWSGKNPPPGMITWNIWCGYPENKIPFVSNDELLKNISDLKSFFNEPNKVARLVGLSGLGKTRLGFETFRPPNNSEDDINQKCLSENVVYTDASELTPGAIIPITFQKKSGILIVDNCDLSLHEKLQREIRHSDSKLSLLSIDFNPEEKYDECEIFEIKPSKDNTVISGIISNAYPGLSQLDIDRITEFAQGFPQIAVLLAKARIDQHPDIGVLKNDLIMKKLIWGNHEENLDELSILKSGSIFEYFGIFDDLTEHRDYLIEKISGKILISSLEQLKNLSKEELFNAEVDMFRLSPGPWQFD